MAKPVTILTSEDSFLLDRALSKIRKEVLNPASAAFNDDRFSGKTDSAAKIINACAMLPMMAETRLVLVREGEQIKKDDTDEWLSYFKKPSPSTCLVIVAAKIDARLKLWKSASELGYLISFKPPYSNELPAWIRNEVSLMGLTLSSEAAHALAGSIGNSLMALVSALEKLSLTIAPRTAITLTDVEEVVGKFFSKTVFDFTECVGGRRLKEASSILDEMILRGEPLVRILFMLSRHFRLLLLAEEALQEGLQPPALAQRLAVPPFFVKDYIRQAQTLGKKMLKNTYRQLLQADRALKGSPLPPEQVMNRFILQACL